MRQKRANFVAEVREGGPGYGRDHKKVLAIGRKEYTFLTQKIALLERRNEKKFCLAMKIVQTLGSRLQIVHAFFKNVEVIFSFGLQQ